MLMLAALPLKVLNGLGMKVAWHQNSVTLGVYGMGIISVILY